jgi:ribosomal protein S18 acetylase RimI-like enzyme
MHASPLENLTIVTADYANPVHANAIVNILDTYARDPMGGSQPLNDHAKSHLINEMAMRPHLFSVLAFNADEAIGLVNCVEGFSTFAARPLVNIHDIAVTPAYRNQGVATRMLAHVEQLARQRGACKLTLEVLEGNHSAYRLYEANAFKAYQLDPAMGHARFLQKWLD